MWRTGLLLTGDLIQAESSSESMTRLEYLRVMMLRHPEEQESILREIVLRKVASNKYREALDELDLYLPSHPYQDNAVLNSYAGLLSFHLALYPTEEPIAPSKMSDVNHSLLRESQIHFERATALDPENIVSSTFLRHISEATFINSHGATQKDEEDPSENDMEVDGDVDRIRHKRPKRDTSMP